MRQFVTACIKLIGIYFFLTTAFSFVMLGFVASFSSSINSLIPEIETGFTFLAPLLAGLTMISLTLFMVFEAERITRWIRVPDVEFAFDVHNLLRIGITLFGVGSFINGISMITGNALAWTSGQNAQMVGLWTGLATLILAVALVKFAPRIASFINQQQKVSDLSEADVL